MMFLCVFLQMTLTLAVCSLFYISFAFFTIKYKIYHKEQEVLFKPFAFLKDPTILYSTVPFLCANVESFACEAIIQNLQVICSCGLPQSLTTGC